jgi:lipopolysaccharide/colanic/teichoic acid biosynthesis glycosyltransferase
VTSIRFGKRSAKTTDADKPRDATEGGRSGEALRRTVNVAVALVSLALAIPLMIVIALLILLTSKGPIIYAQTRVGVDRRSGKERRGRSRGRLSCRRWRNQGGTPFTIYKFRTMKVSPRDVEAQVWAAPDDPRITRVGRVLRKYRLDEIPQLVNVLRGDMNLVGPRPEQPEIFAQLNGRIEGYGFRQRVLPGITGWAQVNHHYDMSDEDVRRKVALDLQYLDRRSAAEDLRIMAKTVPVMMLRKGAL